MIQHRILQLFIICIPFIFSFLTLDPTLHIRFVFLSLITSFLSIYYIFKRKRFVKEIFTHISTLVFLLIIICYCISYIYNASNSDSLFILVKLFLSYILFVFVVNQVSEYSNRDYFRAVVVSLFFTSIIFYLQFFVPFLDQNKINILSSTMANRNLLASFIYLCMPFLIYTMFSDNRIWKILSIIIALLSIPIIVITNSFAVILAIIISSYLFTIIYKKYSIKRQIIYIFSIFILVFISTNIYLDNQKEFNNFNQKLATFISAKSSARIALYSSTFKLIKDNFLFGVGPGNWKTTIQEYDLYKQHNKLDFMHYNGSSSPQRPHNDFLWVFSEAGFLAGIGYLIFFLILVRGSYYHYLKDKSDIFNLLFFCALIGFFCISFVDFPLERISHNIIFLLLIALYIIQDFEKEKYRKILMPKWISYLFLLISFFSIYIGYIRYTGELHLSHAIRYKNASSWDLVIKEIDAAYNENFYTMDNTSTPLLWYKGLAYFNQNKIKNALTYFLKANNDNPNHIHSLNNIATCYGLLGDVERSKKYYYNVLDILPTFKESRTNLAVLYYKEKEYAKAIDILLQSHIDVYQNRIINNDNFDHYLRIIFQSYVNNLSNLTNEELLIFNKIIDEFNQEDLQGKSTFYLQKAYMLKQENNKTYREIILQIYK